MKKILFLAALALVLAGGAVTVLAVDPPHAVACTGNGC